MSDTLISTLDANGVLLANASSNIANMNTRDYKSMRTAITEGAHGDVHAVTTKSTVTGAPDENGHTASNVDLAREVADLITAKTGFEAALSAISTREEMLQDLMSVLTDA